MNFAIIGYGAIGAVHAEILQTLDGARLVAIATRDPEKARRAGERFGCDFYTDYREMLKRADIDVVSLCTPAILHLPMALDVAAAGKHCVIEKPIEINTARSLQIIEAFERRGLLLSVIYQHRFDPAARLLKQAAEQNAFGNLHYGTAKTIWYRDDAYYRATVWRGAWDGDGGGALMNQAIHSIDLLQYLMGPVEAVCGRCDTLGHQIEAEDIGVALLRFRNGALGVIEGTTLAYPGRYSEVSVYGQAGSAGIRNDVLDHYQFLTGDAASFAALLHQNAGTAPHAAHAAQFADVIEALQQHRPPLVTGRDALHSVQIVTAIYESSRKGQWVTIE